MARLSVPGARKALPPAMRRPASRRSIAVDGAASAKLRFGVLVALIVAAFLFGGGSRGDIVSLVILRPLAALACGYALLSLDGSTLRAHRALIAIYAGIVLLVAGHLVPLPPELWQALPGREILAEIDRAAGLGEVWRPITLVPAAGWNALFALVVPVAVLLLAVQCTPAERERLLPLFLILCFASGLIGMLQMIGPSRGPLYFYRITNDGAAVGLFSNRNHASVFLACFAPMAATWIALAPAERRRIWLSAAGLTLILPLIVAAGSRAGLLTGALGLAAAAAILGGARLGAVARRDLKRIGGGALGLALLLSALFFILARGQSIERLTATGQEEDLRFQAWGSVVEAVGAFFPVGSGAGSFAESYQIFEPDALLSPSYFNHAHNDFLEIAMTFGLPGLFLIAFVAWVWLAESWRAWRGGAVVARLGSTLLALLAVASAVDYPLRVPSLAVLATISLLWLRSSAALIDSGSDAGIRAPTSLGRDDVLRHEFSKDFHAAG